MKEEKKIDESDWNEEKREECFDFFPRPRRVFCFSLLEPRQAPQPSFSLSLSFSFPKAIKKETDSETDYKKGPPKKKKRKRERKKKVPLSPHSFHFLPTTTLESLFFFVSLSLHLFKDSALSFFFSFLRCFSYHLERGEGKGRAGRKKRNAKEHPSVLTPPSFSLLQLY